MTISDITGQPFPRNGGVPIVTPSHRILAARMYSPRMEIRAALPQVAYVPEHLDIWGNDSHGDCVSASEAFARACYARRDGTNPKPPQVFITASEVVRWARAHGVLEGASLDEVLDWQVTDGFMSGSQEYNAGRKVYVNGMNEAELQSALSQGPVKIAIDANALPREAGNQQGWYTLNTGRYRNTDHCVEIAGFGPANWVFGQLGVTLPSAFASNPTQIVYLLFTWGTIGVVTFGWLQGTCAEAWLRDPTTTGVPALPPEPGPTPIPPVPVPPEPVPPTPDPVPPSPTPVPPSPVPPTPIPPVPTTIEMTGSVTIPLIVGRQPSGELRVTCGGQTVAFKLVNSGGRSYKPVKKTAGDDQDDDDKPPRRR